jgi:ParB-like nuclease domain
MLHKDSLIIADNRIRRSFKDEEIETLAHSIETKGLLHPPTLRSDEVTLLAGERRIRAILRLHSQHRAFTFAGVVVPEDYIPYNQKQIFSKRNSKKILFE